MPKKTSNRVTKAEWLEAALDTFRIEGEPGIRVEGIARKLKVNKSGFYWHFKDRSDLLEQLLLYWEDEYTKVVTENTILRGLPPRDRLLAVMGMVYDHRLAELDVHFNAWALKDKSVDKVVQRVIKRRTEFIGACFLEAGLEPEEARMRARLFVAHESSERLLFRGTKSTLARTYRERRWRLYLAGIEDNQKAK